MMIRTQHRRGQFRALSALVLVAPVAIAIVGAGHIGHAGRTAPAPTLLSTAAAVAPDTPTMVGPGVISTPDNERSAALTPDGDTLYFTKRTAEPYYSLICVSARVNGQWTTPRVAEFSGRYNDFDPALSTDGRTLVFASTRPAGPDTATTPMPSHLWMVHRGPEGRWGPAERLPEPINSTTVEVAPSFGPDGSLYFASGRPGGAGSLDLYVAKRDGDHFATPTSLGAPNTAVPESYPAVSHDGKLLVFSSVARPDEYIGAGVGYKRGDLYASRWEGDHWGPGIHLPSPINTSAAECCASFSPDGQTMYFTSERGFATAPFDHPITAKELTTGLRSITNGLGNLYSIPTRVVVDLVAHADTAPGAP